MRLYKSDECEVLDAQAIYKEMQQHPQFIKDFTGKAFFAKEAPLLEVTDSEEINAFAFLNNENKEVISITAALLNSLASPQELKTILAHELKHHLRKDYYNINPSAQATTLIAFVLVLFLIIKSMFLFAGLTAFVSMFVILILNAKLSQIAEFKCDEYSLQYTSIDAALLVVSRFNFHCNPSKSLKILSLFSSHPRGEERVKNLTKKAHKA